MVASIVQCPPVKLQVLRMYMHVYLCIYTYWHSTVIYMNNHVYVHIHNDIHMCMCLGVLLYMYVYMYTRTCMHICLYLYGCI